MTEITEETTTEEVTGPPPIERVVNSLARLKALGNLIFGTEDAVSDSEKDEVVQEFRDAFPGASDELLVRIAHHEATMLANTDGDAASAAISCVLSASIGARIATEAGLG